MSRWLAALAASIFFAVVPLAASSTDEQIVQMAETALHQSGAPSVSIAVIKDGKLSFSRAFGKADLEQNRPASTRTRYAVGSVSKQFTVAAILLLQEEGKLTLDDHVSEYFPSLTRANEVSIRELLSHTSGYEDYAPQDYIIPAWQQPTTPQAIMDHWGRKALNFDPGTRWQYSNTNYVIAGAIFEKVSGKQLVPFLKEKIFDPLGMSSAGEWTQPPADDATAYGRYALGPPRPVKREAPGWYFAAGELAMTAEDLAKWDAAFLSKKILSANSWAEFTREVKLKNGDATHYALGLSVGQKGGVPVISHGGEVSGFLSYNVLFPTLQGGIVTLSNQDEINLIDPLSDRIAETVFFGGRTPMPADTTEVQTILAGLQTGKIDRTRFTENANSYFSETALGDYRQSLQSLGALQSVSKTSESQRGGMTHRSYKAQFAKKTVLLNIYVVPDGRYEQFLVEEQVG